MPDQYYYDWDSEEEKFGPLRPAMNRASDDEDEDDLSKPEVRRAYLSERLKERAKIAELKGDIQGIELMIQHREIALEAAKQRENFVQEDFDALNPPWELPGVDVTVRDIYGTVKMTLSITGA